MDTTLFLPEMYLKSNEREAHKNSEKSERFKLHTLSGANFFFEFEEGC